MKKHNGMRPQDIVILLKIITLGDRDWQLKDLAQMLYISPSEITESLARSIEANLIDHNKKRVNRQNLLEFILYGLRYVYPASIGSMVKGISTAHSHPFMKEFGNGSAYVWPDMSGKVRGESIDPLYPNLIKAVKEDEKLYKLLALTDVMRVGRAREISVAKDELKKMIVNGSAD
jgi:hypothetical protein